MASSRTLHTAAEPGASITPAAAAANEQDVKIECDSLDALPVADYNGHLTPLSWKRLMNKTMPPRLQEIVDEFEMLQGREKLEYLLELAESLPPLPERLAAAREANQGMVHECMTPVFVYAEAENGHLRYHFDVPPESPTVRGYAAIMQEGTAGLRPDEVVAIPDDFYLNTGLSEVLSSQRLNGLGAILGYVKQLARAQSEHI
jgi:cysteine desulfuration protein SufE